ncbi:RNA-directed DNA polymerase, eukaryota, reverse transcriptase zinc-binding domain protein [Tanacetum coccineum]
MHCDGWKTVSDLHALLIDYEKGLKDKVTPTPQVFSIQKGRDNKSKPQGNKQKKGKGKADKNKQVVPSQPKPNPKKRKENSYKEQELVTTRAHDWCIVRGTWPSLSRRFEQRRKIRDGGYSCLKYAAGYNPERKLAYGINISYGQWTTTLSRTATRKKIKALRSDRGGEYLSQEFKDYLSENGIVQNLTSQTPQQNEYLKRKSILAVRIINMFPLRRLIRHHIEIWHCKVPNNALFTGEQRQMWRFAAQNMVELSTNPGKLHWVAVSVMRPGNCDKDDKSPDGTWHATEASEWKQFGLEVVEDLDFKGRLPVREELDKRGIDLDSTLCPCCDSMVESCVHSLVLRNFSTSVWEKVFSWWKLGSVNAFSIGELFSSNGNIDILDCSILLWQAVIWTSGYYIWKVRIARVFKGKVVLISVGFGGRSGPGLEVVVYGMQVLLLASFIGLHLSMVVRQFMPFAASGFFHFKWFFCWDA